MRLAANEGVTVAALVDHDTTAGLVEAGKAAEAVGVRLVPGIELSVDHRRSKIHLLVYFVDPARGSLNDELAGLIAGRNERNHAIIARLGSLGYQLSIDDVLQHAAGASIGRPHIADALIAKGYITHRNEVFEHLLHDGGPAYVERTRLTARRAIELARADGAVPVVAHPVTINPGDLSYDELFAELADIGLGGIEAHHPMHAPGLRSHLAKVAGSLGVAATGGSDYHGETARTYRIRFGSGDLRIPEDAIDQLEAQRDR
jgi:predicted metal-dependent phosphoesterase TrpH